MPSRPAGAGAGRHRHLGRRRRAGLGWGSVATVGDLGAIPRSLPLPAAPLLRVVPSLLVPALSLALVGLIQGAGISASFPNPDGRYPDASRDFIGQGAANVIAGVFRGMPVGGSMSATALNKTAGARSRLALMTASLMITITISHLRLRQSSDRSDEG